jgi:hypothetical protein
MNTKDLLARVLDRSKSIDGIAETVIDHWAYDLYTRSPGPALLENGVLKPTDLDLACFMSALAERGAVISLPTYERRRPKVVKEGEVVVSAQNRHGKVLGLTSNKEVFSFSVLVQDMNVMTTDTVGAPRNFMLVDLDGTWHDGWKSIQFLPTAKENEFLSRKSLWTDNTVVFKNFVHPNRWISFYGSYYFLTKALIARMEEEAKARIAQQASGGGDAARDAIAVVRRETETGPSTSTIVHTFQAEVDVPWENSFPSFDPSTNTETWRSMRYKLLPQLRFAARATELAFFKAEGWERMPSWHKGAEWMTVKIKRTEWKQLMFAPNVGIPRVTEPSRNKSVFETPYALRFRTYDKTEKVAP